MSKSAYAYIHNYTGYDIIIMIKLVMSCSRFTTLHQSSFQRLSIIVGWFLCLVNFQTCEGGFVVGF